MTALVCWMVSFEDGQATDAQTCRWGTDGGHTCEPIVRIIDAIHCGAGMRTKSFHRFKVDGNQAVKTFERWTYVIVQALSLQAALLLAENIVDGPESSR